jgi:pSer/pThr/pTyr-binding forkhead associated (FHA) protein
MAKKKDNLFITVRCMGHKAIKIRPGDTLRIGRHHSNDLVLSDGTVSRFHAAIEWDKDEDRPWVVDNDSANGVDIDDRVVDVRAPLSGDNQVGVGDFTLILQLTAPAAREAPEALTASDHLIDDDDGEATGKVRLYSESAATVEGRFTNTNELQRIALDIEEKQRTGTLKVSERLTTHWIMFGNGGVVNACYAGEFGVRSLVEILNMSEGRFEFSADIEFSEDNLKLSVKKVLARQSETTMRFNKTGPSKESGAD